MATTTNKTPDTAPATDNASETPQVELAKAPETPAEDVTMADLVGIRFTGYAGQGSSRSISIEDFKGVGVNAPKDLVWNHENGFTVPAGDVNAAVRDYLVMDGEFELVSKA